MSATLECLSIFNDAIEVHKYLQGIYIVDCSELLPLHAPGNMKTRGQFEIRKKRNCKLRLGQNFFFWNLNCECMEQFTYQSGDRSHCELL